MIPMCDGGIIMKEEDSKGEKGATHNNKNKEFEKCEF